MLNDPKLSETASTSIADRENLCLVSAASQWEVAIKISVGKYRISDDFETLWNDVLSRFATLNIEPRHTAKLISLPFHHKDPFDRLLIAQSLAEQIPVISSDAVLDAYGIQRIW